MSSQQERRQWAAALSQELREVADQLPEGHHERPGLIRSAELVRHTPLAPDQGGPYETMTGRTLTEADIEKLAAEAERGYCVEKVDGALCGQPLPCWAHGDQP